MVLRVSLWMAYCMERKCRGIVTRLHLILRSTGGTPCGRQCRLRFVGPTAPTPQGQNGIPRFEQVNSLPVPGNGNNSIVFANGYEVVHYGDRP